MKKIKLLFWIISFTAILLSVLHLAPGSVSATSSNVQTLNTTGTIATFSPSSGHGVGVCININGLDKNNHKNYSVSGETNASQKVAFGYDSNNNCFSSSIISGTSQNCATFGGGTNLSQLPTNLLNVTAKNTSTGSSAVGKIQLCNAQQGRIYNTSPQLNLINSASAAKLISSVTVDANYFPLSCTSSCNTKPLSGGNVYGEACLIPQGSSSCKSQGAQQLTASNAKLSSSAKYASFTAMGVPYGKYSVFIQYNFASATAATYKIESSEANKIYNLDTANPSPIQVTLVTAPGGKPVVPPTTANPSQTPSGGPSQCESSGFSLAWVVCPIINAVTGAEQGIEHIVQHMLQTPPISFNGSLSCSNSASSSCNYSSKFSSAIYHVWSNFRLYGDIILVIAMLVIVYGEAAGGGVIEAYTVRKVLPRILVAAILINLSIYIVAGLEDIFNILGAGISSVIEAPFRAAAGPLNVHGLKMNIGGGTGLLGAGAISLGLGALAFGVLTAGTIAILFLVVLMVLVAILGIFIIVIVRQGLLVFLLLISPVAFALYVLPNTEQYYKKWWGLLIKTLTVYPIITAVFAMAYVSGVVLSDLTPSNVPTIIAQCMALIAVVSPLFLIPFAFRMSGGVIGGVAGAVSKMTSRVNKPLMGMAKKSAVNKFNRTAGGKAYAGGNPNNIRGALNRGLQRAAIIGSGKAGYNVFNPRKIGNNATSIMAGHNLGELEEIEKDKEFATWNGDDTIAKAATQSVDDAGFRRRLQQLRPTIDEAELDKVAQSVDRVRRKYGSEAFRQATYMHAVAGGTAYDGEAGAGEMARDLLAAAGTDQSMRRTLIARTKSITAQAGRGDYNASFGTWAQNLETMEHELVSTGGISDATLRSVTQNIEASAADSTDVGSAERVKPQAAEHLADAHVRNIGAINQRIAAATQRINTAQSQQEAMNAHQELNDAQAAMDEELASTMGLADYLSSAPPNVARAYRRRLLDASVIHPDTGQELSVFDLANDNLRTSRPAYIQIRSAYAARAQELNQRRQTMDPGGPQPNPPGPGTSPGAPGPLGGTGPGL